MRWTTSSGILLANMSNSLALKKSSGPTGKSCWYKADTLHPNTASIIVLEKCLVDGKSIRPSIAVRFDNDEVVERRQFIRLNNSKATISLRGSDCEDSTPAKRSFGIISSDSSEEETIPVWKRHK